MESLFAHLFLDIQQRIRQQVPDIRWIEQDFGQDAFDKWRPNVDFPALLIDFVSTDYSDTAGTSQLAITTIVVRMLVTPFSQSYEAAPIEVREDALQYFELEHKVVCALHGWLPGEDFVSTFDTTFDTTFRQPDGTYCQPLIRTRAMSQNRNDIGLRIREIHFTTAHEEF